MGKIDSLYIVQTTTRSPPPNISLQELIGGIYSPIINSNIIIKKLINIDKGLQIWYVSDCPGSK